MRARRRRARRALGRSAILRRMDERVAPGPSRRRRRDRPAPGRGAPAHRGRAAGHAGRALPAADAPAGLRRGRSPRGRVATCSMSAATRGTGRCGSCRSPGASWAWTSRPGRSRPPRRARSTGGRSSSLSERLRAPVPDDASFDLVTSFQVLEHVPDPSVFLAELSRVTRPGGSGHPRDAECGDPAVPGHDALESLPRPGVPGGRAARAAGRCVRRRRGARACSVRPSCTRPRSAASMRRDSGSAGRRKPRLDARPRAWRRRRVPRPPAAAAGRRDRPWVWRAARAVTPAVVRGWARSLRHASGAQAAQRPPIAVAERPPMAAVEPPIADAATPPEPIDLEAFLRFTVDDLWYAATDLDRAMDLLAICAWAATTRAPDPCPGGSTRSPCYTLRPVRRPRGDRLTRWGCSSAGRAPRSHRGGQGFESPHLHHRSTSGAWPCRATAPPVRAAVPDVVPAARA